MRGKRSVDPGSGPEAERPLLGRCIAVTGAAGFIGAFTAAELAARGGSVVAIDRDPGPRTQLIDPIASGRIELVAAPTRWPYPESWWTEVERTGLLDPVDTVVHLGYAEPTVADPLTAYRQEVEANVGPTIDLLERLGSRVETICLASSSLIYGRGHRAAIPETTEPRPDSPYGLAKLDVERALAWWAGDGRQAVAARIATVYGPTETVPRAVPTFVRAVLAGRRPEIAVGDDRRDYIHVGDVARGLAALVGAASTIVGPGRCSAINLGTGRATTTLELARSILDLVGSSAEPVLSEPNRGSVSVVVDPTLLHRSTGFEPSVELRSGLAEEVAWFRRRPELWSVAASGSRPMGAGP